MLHPKIEQARISAQILASYSNSGTHTTPAMSQMDFEKSVIDDKIHFIFDEAMQGWSLKMQDKLQSEKDDVKKSALSGQIKAELAPLFKIDVVFDRMTKSFWVDIIDIETKTFKENSLTKKLNLAGKKV